MRTTKKLTVLCLIVVILFSGYLLLSNHIISIPFLDPYFEDQPQEASMDNGWQLILVNSDYCIPEDYEMGLTTLSNGEQVDSRIYPDLQQMFDDMRDQGIYPLVRAGYRSHEDQQALMQQRIEAYEAEGYSRSQAEELAADWVAEPGTSEHELGIAVDINQDVERSTAEEVYSWLADNAHSYGFILRYPSDKIEITGISNEPWHYRYVGKDAAIEMFNSGLCLEEYIETLP